MLGGVLMGGAAAFLVQAHQAPGAPAGMPRTSATSPPEPAGPLPLPPSPPAAQAARETETGQCRAAYAPPHGFDSSRSLSHARNRTVTTNASTLAAVLALAEALREPVDADQLVSVLEQEDEVCVFEASAGPAGEVLVVRILSFHERNVSLRKDVALHLLALGERGPGFRLKDVLDFQESRRSVRLFEERVPSDADDASLLRIALAAGEAKALVPEAPRPAPTQSAPLPPAPPGLEPEGEARARDVNPPAAPPPRASGRGPAAPPVGDVPAPETATPQGLPATDQRPAPEAARAEPARKPPSSQTAPSPSPSNASSRVATASAPDRDVEREARPTRAAGEASDETGNGRGEQEATPHEALGALVEVVSGATTPLLGAPLAQLGALG